MLRARLLALSTVALLLVGGLVTTIPAQADEGSPSSPPAADVRAALVQARQATSTRNPGRTVDLTLALTQLRLGLDRLAPNERREALQLLARPTDNPDPGGFAYQVAEATPLCSTNFCIHYVATTTDAPPAVDANANGIPDQVERTSQLMEQVLAMTSGQLGYRAPAPDGLRGGDARFDVYLSNVGAQGLYGFCAPETLYAALVRYTGYCVLDNDFVGFASPPDASLVVTAAHEFFHAVQFNYDAAEDPWMSEATATWFEERFAPDVNDNHQYLKRSQLRLNKQPLDLFNAQSGAQYGNFIFFELMSKLYGVNVVREIYDRADSGTGAPDDYSTKAIDKVLKRHGSSFADFYARFAAANTAPAAFYTEGAAYPRASAKKVTLRKKRSFSASKRLNHLTNQNYTLRPQGFKKGTLRLKFDAPSKAVGGAVRLTIVSKNGSTRIKKVRIKRGHGRARVGFGTKRVRSVTVTFANTSIRVSNCWRNTSYACQGNARDDHKLFRFSART